MVMLNQWWEMRMSIKRLQWSKYDLYTDNKLIEDGNQQLILSYFNNVLTVIFILEALMKITATRQYYFKIPWNIFDFVVVLIAALDMALLSEYFSDVVSPTLFMILRVLRTGRLLRLIKSAKGIRTLLFSLLVSLPALFNIALLLFLVIFIYSILGMALFSNVKQTSGIDDTFNFEAFFPALITLFPCATSAGWNDVLDALIKSSCTHDRENLNCNSPTLGIVYLASYLVVTFFVIINMYIAVIMENFGQATADLQQGITQDDIDKFFEMWVLFDPEATHYIPVESFFQFADALDEPLRVPKPNYFCLIMTDIPVCKGDLLHCSDVLDALTKLFITNDTDPYGYNDILLTDMERNRNDSYKPIYGLLERQRVKRAARLICRRYREYCRKKRARENKETNTNKGDY